MWFGVWSSGCCSCFHLQVDEFLISRKLKEFRLLYSTSRFSTRCLKLRVFALGFFDLGWTIEDWGGTFPKNAKKK